MILFAGIPTEPPIALAIDSAVRQRIPHLVLNQRRWAFCDLEVGLRSGELQGRLWLDERLWSLNEIVGIYSRTVEPNTLPEHQPRGSVMPDAGKLARSAFMHDLFNDCLEVVPCRVVNRPGAMASNSSKPFQAQRIVAHGFATPATLVTNDPEQVRAFHALHRHIIYKSISSIRSIVKEWRASEQSDLEKVRLLPTQFQALVPGTNIRVHVVAESVFATAIESEAVDYRYAAREGHDIDLRATILPPEIENKCRKLTASLGLAFAGIDLKRTPQGEWYCFEVNTSPGYSYFQEQTGQKIADALVGYLAGAVRESARVGGGDCDGTGH